MSLRGVVLVAPAPARPAPVPDAVRAQMQEAYRTRDTVIATLDTVLRHATLGDALREQVVEDSLAGSPAAKEAWPARTLVEDVITTGGAFKRRSVYGKTWEEAHEKLTKLKADSLNGLPVATNKMTIAEYMTYWLTNIAQGKVRRTTYVLPLINISEPT